MKATEGIDLPDGLLRIGYHSAPEVNTLVMNNASVVVENSSVSTGVFYLDDGCSVTLNDVDVTAKGTQEDDIVGVFYRGNGLGGNVVLENGTTITTEKVNAVFYRVCTDISDSEIVCTNNYKPVFRGAEGSVSNTDITVNGALVDMDDDNHPLVQALDADVIKFVNGTTVVVDATTPVVADNSSIDVLVDETVTIPDDANVKQYAAKIGTQYYVTIADAVKAAVDGDTVTVLPGRYSAVNISSKNIIFEGSVAEDGTLLTELYGGNPAITGHRFNGTIRNLKVTNSFKVFYGEPCGNIVFDNLYVTGATYGLHPVAYQSGLTWTIQNCYMDLSWANSFGTYQCEPATIIIKNNKFDSTSPYYPDYGAPIVNTGSPNTIVEDNVFGENTKIQFLTEEAAAEIKLGTNYYADGAENFIVSDNEYDAQPILSWYETEEMENVSTIAAAQVDDEFYATLKLAVEDAEKDDEITVVNDISLTDTLTINKDVNINLGGKTLSFVPAASTFTLASVTPVVGQLKITDGEVIISNGTIDVTGTTGQTIRMGNTGKLTLNSDVKLVGDGLSGDVIYMTNGANVLTLNGTKVALKNIADIDGTYFIKTEPDFGFATVVMNGADVSIENGAGFMVNTAVDVDNSKIVVTGLGRHGLRNISGTIDNTELTMNVTEDGIKSSAGNPLLTIGGDSVVTINAAGNAYNATIAELNVTGGAYNVDPQAFAADGYEVSRTAFGFEVVKTEKLADTISVIFVEDEAKRTEEAKVYNVVLKANGTDNINELASAELTFDLKSTRVSDGAMSFTVLPAADFTLTRYDDLDINRYMFNYNGTTAHEGIGNEIVVGTITVDGFGTFTIGTDNTSENAKNVVHATTVSDNLVDSYTVDGLNDTDETTGGLDISGNVPNGEIAVAKRNLEINITFPNKVEKKAAAYQDMTVTIVGGNVDEEIKLGDGTETTYDVVNDAYVITRDLPYNTTYTVTVSGAGYRTARYAVTLNDNKTLNFWNNVMDNKLEVEVGKATSAQNTTFLAGDIVKDNNINIYDLSAVVAYFGTEGLDANNNPGYAKYDLNRDGVIDSKDVAYVLVSWNN